MRKHDKKDHNSVNIPKNGGKQRRFLSFKRKTLYVYELFISGIKQLPKQLCLLCY